MQDELVFSVSDFVAVFNQTISYAYPNVTIQGEIDSLRISKNRWVYFNLKDEQSSVKFFASTTQLPGPLEDGLLMKVRGVPYLHPNYGFSINVQFMQPVGEGSLKRAAQLLEAKLTTEGLFDPNRKRQIEYPPKSIGLITSIGSAAYHDFIKILAERWGGIDIQVVDVQVQGEVAPEQIISALNHFNLGKQPVDVVVLIRGGGSADDLAAFNTEIVTRAVATSRIPTLVAIGHEVDLSLAELAADKRGSTPTHAAEVLTPDKNQLLEELKNIQIRNLVLLENHITAYDHKLNELENSLNVNIGNFITLHEKNLDQYSKLLQILSPLSVLKRGFAIIKSQQKVLTSGKKLKAGDQLQVELIDAKIDVLVKAIELH